MFKIREKKKITELENQIIDLRIAFNEAPNKIQSGKKGQKQEQPTNNVEGNFDDGGLRNELKPPKKEPVLEESEQYQPIVNQIIVSI